MNIERNRDEMRWGYPSDMVDPSSGPRQAGEGVGHHMRGESCMKSSSLSINLRGEGGGLKSAFQRTVGFRGSLRGVLEIRMCRGTAPLLVLVESIN